MTTALFLELNSIILPLRRPHWRYWHELLMSELIDLFCFCFQKRDHSMACLEMLSLLCRSPLKSISCSELTPNCEYTPPNLLCHSPLKSISCSELQRYFEYTQPNYEVATKVLGINYWCLTLLTFVFVFRNRGIYQLISRILEIIHILNLPKDPHYSCESPNHIYTCSLTPFYSLSILFLFILFSFTSEEVETSCCVCYTFFHFWRSCSIYYVVCFECFLKKICFDVRKLTCYDSRLAFQSHFPDRILTSRISLLLGYPYVSI
jgi:hypothetical protein